MMQINVELSGDCQVELDQQHINIRASLQQQGYHEYQMNKLHPGKIMLIYVDSKTWEKLREQHYASCRNSLGSVNIIGHDIGVSGLTNATTS